MKDIEKLQGAWNIISLEMDGRSVPVSGGKIAIKGTHFTTTGMGGAYRGTIEVDATQTPRAFNLIFSTGPEKGNTNLGIYELDVDTWRICLATRGTTRPKKFAAEPGTGIALEVLRREGTAAAPPVEKDQRAEALNIENVHFEPVPEFAGEWSMVSGLLDGQPLDKTMVSAARRVVEGNGMTVYFGPQVYSKAKFTVDRSKTPMTIDYYSAQGAGAGKMQLGIYELNEGTLKICLGPPGQERPNDFVTAHGDGRTLAVWARKK